MSFTPVAACLGVLTVVARSMPPANACTTFCLRDAADGPGFGKNWILATFSPRAPSLHR